MAKTNEEKALSIKDDEKAEMIAYSCSHPLRCERCGAYIWEAKDSADTAFKSAMKMAKWKDEDAKAEKQALIDKACEWLRNNIEYYTDTQNDSEGNLCEVILEDALIRDFRNAMKGGNYE